ncbi:MAG: FmdB family transcriptional regulator [Acidimicrobiaceae bacterium]|nr:FmdB family transcriptional regulator [Acidimicrobiaceae bacterium]
MPTYEYACKTCGQHIDVFQSFSDDPLTECPNCGGELRKVFGNIAISFKGSGFYKNDSRSDGNGHRSPSNGSSNGKSTSSEGAGSGSSSEGSSSSSDGNSSSSSSSESASSSSSDGGSPAPAKKEATTIA